MNQPDTKASWLRSEIEKLEKSVAPDMDSHGFDYEAVDYGYNQALTSIITRYKEELLELEKGV